MSSVFMRGFQGFIGTDSRAGLARQPVDRNAAQCLWAAALNIPVAARVRQRHSGRLRTTRNAHSRALWWPTACSKQLARSPRRHAVD